MIFFIHANIFKNISMSVYLCLLYHLKSLLGYYMPFNFYIDHFRGLILDDNSFFDAITKRTLRVCEIIILCLISWYIFTIYMGIDGRTYAFKYHIIKPNLNISYLVACVFPIILIIIEDFRIQQKDGSSFFWYRMMELSSLILWCLAGWLFI